ncbi:GNAT family N-acetyltransferase, partial [Salinibacterium sp.]|uniref:GNAT family N-acetyltransferase n=1 Tax=Salinibacterium sp. TaxID=1915057 RepID=UPI00286BEBDB
QTRGQSPDGAEWWLNWVVALRDSRKPVGYVQATVEDDGSKLVADIAWVITPRQQGQGIASEATRAMVEWLRLQGVGHFTAHIHPDHLASMGVARNQALHPTSVERDGEIRWEL